VATREQGPQNRSVDVTPTTKTAPKGREVRKGFVEVEAKERPELASIRESIRTCETHSRSPDAANAVTQPGPPRCSKRFLTPRCRREIVQGNTESENTTQDRVRHPLYQDGAFTCVLERRLPRLKQDRSHALRRQGSHCGRDQAGPRLRAETDTWSAPPAPVRAESRQPDHYSSGTKELGYWTHNRDSATRTGGDREPIRCLSQTRKFGHPSV